MGRVLSLLVAMFFVASSVFASSPGYQAGLNTVAEPTCGTGTARTYYKTSTDYTNQTNPFSDIGSLVASAYSAALLQNYTLWLSATTSTTITISQQSISGTGAINTQAFYFRCVAQPCQASAGDSYPLIHSSDGNEVPGDEVCYNQCVYQAVAGTAVVVTKATGTATTTNWFDWLAEAGTGPHGGKTCGVQPVGNPATMTNGLRCKAIAGAGLYGGTIQTCFTPGGKDTFADASDVVRDGQDLGPSLVSSDVLNGQGCVTTSSGAAFCTVGFVNVPDKGTPGSPATPDAQVTNVNGQCTAGAVCSTNYYSAGTVWNSTNYGSGRASGTTSGTSGGTTGGTSGGSTGGTSGGSGGGTCDASKAKCGDGGSSPYSGPGGGSQTFEQTLNTFYAQVQASPLATALDGFADGVPTGSANTPTSSFTAFGRSYTLSVPVEISNAVSSVLVVVMHIFWLLVGVMIYYSGR